MSHHHTVGDTIERIRHECESTIIFHDTHERLCAFCHHHKATKGGCCADPRMWKCADSVERMKIE